MTDGRVATVEGPVPEAARTRPMTAEAVTTQLSRTGGTPYRCGQVRALVEENLSLPLAALFGLVFQWGIFWVYVGIMAEQFVKFGIGLYRLRSREWINDVTQFSRTE